ncbi:adenylate/guanylate cyclase domain-containing protein [Methylovirgula ligni]|uniref:Adenylate/guanylate cyclase n=1 Tax=Methylovirgula ligni TaxID=569860 RepID=A0A3D9YU70_9HYPH|nr:adenylate/guanylate cyclase domain-containing protein [Methylovirgula ligni]QAY96259.1 adenylate/guanylate cyclase domain-containing protein [Methylovirgula ligni]REF86034.1 adenylate/guanylate cyclase [Methylovirgula ligni]
MLAASPGKTIAAWISPLVRSLPGALVWALPIGLGLLLCLESPPLVERLRNLVFDYDQQVEPRRYLPDLPVRVVDIDDSSLARLGQWPWPRHRLADLARHLFAQGAAVVAFDILFSEQDRAAPQNLIAQLPDVPERKALGDALAARGLMQDNSLTQVLASGPSVLTLVLTNGNSDEVSVKSGFATLGDDPRPFLLNFRGAILPLPDLQNAAAGLGSINWAPDRDLIVRKVPLVFTQGANAALVPSLDAEILRVAQHASTILIKSSNASDTGGFGARTGVVSVKIGALEIATESDGAVRVHYAGTKAARHISAWRVLAGKVANDDIAGRIVLIGSSASALADIRSTPLEAAVPGVDIHAELLEHVLSGTRLARPDYAPGLEALLVVLGGAIMSLLARFTKPVAAVTVLLLSLEGLAFASFYAFSRTGLLFDALMPGATWVLAYAAMTIAVYRRSERQREFVRKAFSRYLAPALVERLAKDPSRLELGGEARDVSVLFADVRDFTRRSEGLSAVEVVQFLNGVLTPLTQSVLVEAGTIDKYFGDGLMAFWNAPIDVPNHAEHACAAALAMRAALPALNAHLVQTGIETRPIELGIGINTGEAFVGNMGSDMRFDYSIVGDTVNVASRLEEATKHLGVPIVVAETTMRAAPGFRFVPLGETLLRGRSQPTPIYALHGRADVEDLDFSAFLQLHEAALAAAAMAAPDAAAKIRAAREHPYGEAYVLFYSRLGLDIPAFLPRAV